MHWYMGYMRQREMTPRFLLEQISRFTWVRTQEEQVWGGGIKEIVLNSSILDMLTLRGLLEI